MVCKNKAKYPDGKCKEEHLESRYQILHSDGMVSHRQCINRVFVVKMECCEIS